jgi:collagen beta-1,O-galactosyltransferase
MTWKMAYEKRDLNAFSVEPLLMYPTHYTNEAGYISDTERSSVLFQPNCTIKRDEL